MTLTQILQKIKSAFYNKSETDALLSSKSDTSHNHNSVYLGISAKAESSKSADSVAWNNVSGKPSSYTPSSHTHDDRYYTESEIDTKLSGKSNTNHTHSNYLTSHQDISGKANTSGTYSGLNVGYATSSGTANYLGNVAEIVYGVDRLNYFNVSTGTTSGATNVANPTNAWYHHLVMNHGNNDGYYFDIACAFFDNAIYYRRVEGGAEKTWVRLIDSSTIGSQSVNYANSAGSVAWANVSGRPTAVSSFTNDSGYITSAGSCNYANSTGWATTSGRVRTQSHPTWWINCNWDGSYFQTDCIEDNGSHLPVNVQKSNYADSAGSANDPNAVHKSESITNLPLNGGIYWNPYVESAGDGSDAASITVIPNGVAGGTELRIQQANDANDVVNLVGGQVRVAGDFILNNYHIFVG